jgi:hypothetical protein
MYSYNLGGVKLEFVKGEKDLGVMVTFEFSQDQQVVALLSKAALTKINTQVINLPTRIRARKSVYVHLKRPFTCTLADLHTRNFLTGCRSANFGSYGLKRNFLRVSDDLEYFLDLNILPIKREIRPGRPVNRGTR